MKTIKPRKQRKRLYQAPLHKRYKRFSAPLSPELKKSRIIKSIPLRTGDTVKIMRGEHRGVEGKVSLVNRRDYSIVVEGVNREKVDGTSIPVPIHPSKVMITNLNLDDKWRRRILERKALVKKDEMPKEEPKPPAEVVKSRTVPRKTVKGSGGV